MLSQKISSKFLLPRKKFSKSIISLSTSTKLQQNDPRSPIDKSQVFTADLKIFRIIQADIEFTGPGLKKFFKKSILKAQKDNQQFSPSMLKEFGSDLLAGNFVLLNNGKVKYKNIDRWLGSSTGEDDEVLPKTFDANYIITGIDLSDVRIHYEGLNNFENCKRIRTAIFQRSPLFDEWYVDRLTHLLPELEYFDLSDCPKVNERALEAMYRFGRLKTLIVTNHKKTATFELTCMMLEDVIPGLRVKILEPKKTK